MPAPLQSLLVTGGAGFIGTNFVRYWMQERPACRMVVLDSLTYAGNTVGLGDFQGRENFHFVQGDIRDTPRVSELLKQYRIDTIVHFAAESHVDRSISGPDAFVEANVVGTHSLLKAAREVWTGDSELASRRFLHISTDEVFGSLCPKDPAFTETSAYAPNSPYAATKAASDHLVRAYHHTYGLPVVTTNCSNNYGPYQYPEKLIPLMIVNALHGRHLPIYGDGMNVRDWLYVNDHCRGIALALSAGQTGCTYNIGGSNERTNIEVARLLCDEIDQAFAAQPDLKQRFPRSPAASGRATSELIKFVTDRPGHDRRYAVDARRISAELGFRPLESMSTGLRKTLAWYLAHESWWRPLLNLEFETWMQANYAERDKS